MATLVQSMTERPKLFTPNMAMVSALLGGPLAAGTLIFLNYKRLGEQKKASKALLWTLATVALLFVISILFAPFYIKGVNSGITAGVMVAARQYTKQLQWQEESPKASWWMALLIGMMGLVASVFPALIIASLLMFLFPGQS